MALRHSAEFTGVDVSDTFRTKTKVFEDSGSSDDCSDEMSSDKTDSDSADSGTKLPTKKKEEEKRTSAK